MKLVITGCSQLLTLAGPARPRTREEMRQLGIVPEGAMRVENGRIAATGTRAEIEASIDAETEVIDAGGRAVLPGFVDAHTHPVFAGTRVDEYELRATGASYAEIAAAGGGIRSTVRATRAASEDELVCGGRRYRDWFLACGTTTIEAKSGYGLSLDDELKLLRAIRRLDDEGPLRYVPTFLGAHEIPDEYRARPEDYVRLLIERMLPHVGWEGLARYCDIFCEPTVFPVETARRILTAAREHGLGLRVHADQLTASGAAELAAELGAATADHLEQTGEAGMRALAAARVQPVLLPGSVYALGHTRYAAARAMIDAGLAVVLATDFNPGSSPTPSMPMVLSLASTQMKMTPAEALTAATINAAWSLDRGGELGSLEPEKLADFVIHDAADYREIACFFGLPRIQGVWVAGRRVLPQRCSAGAPGAGR